MRARTTQAGVMPATPLETGPDCVPDLSFHASVSLPAGSESLLLAVGGIHTRLTGLTALQRSALAERFGIFCRDESARPSSSPVTRIEVTKAPRRAFLAMRERGEIYRVDTRWEGEILLACSYEWAGWLDRAEGRGGLSLAEVTEEDPRAFDRSLENFLRVLYAHAVVPNGGFLLHSAGLVREGRAFLFFGPSGSGKTTVTTLSPEALVLSDDLTMVVRSPEGEYRACSVPFRGLHAPRPESERSWPLAGFFRLVKDTRDALVEVRGARAVGELVGSLPFVTERSEIAGDVMDVVASAASRVPVYRLHFRKDPAFWSVIPKQAPEPGNSPSIDDFPVEGGRYP